MKTALALIAAMTATTAQADMTPDRASLLIGSRHVGASGMFNETNPGLFLTWEDRVGSLDFTAGVFHNSYEDTSYSLTASLPVAQWDNGQLEVFAGLAHYDHASERMAVSYNNLVPLAGLQARHGNLFAQVIPMDGKPVDAVVSFGLTFEIN